MNARFTLLFNFDLGIQAWLDVFDAKILVPGEETLSSQKKQKIVVHVGLPKTGTTFLQDILSHNRQNLNKLGISLLLREETNSFIERVQTKIFSREPIGKRTGLLDYEISRQNNLVISDERLAGEVGYWDNSAKNIYGDIHIWAKEICNEFPEADICFFITLRSYADAFDSGYIQCVKMGIDVSVEQFKKRLQEIDFTWTRVIKDLKAAIAPSRLKVFEFGKSVNDSIIEEMEAHLGPLNLVSHPKPRPNKRYGDISIQIAQLANPILNRQGQIMLRRILENQVIQDPGATFSLFSPEEAIELNGKFEKDMRKIESFWGRRISTRRVKNN